jgi:XRE family transcriptional regulator, regulator of sulfur utilization
MEDINNNISKNLKSIRKEKGLTLDELADVSGVSKSMLGEIERGGTNPTILVLWKIADGLRIPLTKLIDAEAVDYTLVRADQQKIIDEEKDFSIYSIFPYHFQHRSEVLKLKINPHGTLSNNGHKNGLDETIYVLNGMITVILNNESFELNCGDSIRFKGELNHQLINTSDEPVHLINILNYP